MPIKIFKIDKKDLNYSWFSGTGAGGQNRNKTMNCLRLKHIPTGIQVTAQRQRDRLANEQDALDKLTKRVKAFLHPEAVKERFRAKEVIRNYRESDNLVKDLASGDIFSYKEIILDADTNEVGKMIISRKNHMEQI